MRERRLCCVNVMVEIVHGQGNTTCVLEMFEILQVLDVQKRKSKAGDTLLSVSSQLQGRLSHHEVHIQQTP